MSRFSIRTRRPDPGPDRLGMVVDGLNQWQGLRDSRRDERNAVAAAGGVLTEKGRSPIAKIADYLKRSHKKGVLKERQRQGQDIVGPMPGIVDIRDPQTDAVAGTRIDRPNLDPGRNAMGGRPRQPAYGSGMTPGYNPSASHPMAGQETYTFEGRGGDKYQMPRNGGLAAKLAEKRAELELEDEFGEKRVRRSAAALRGRYGDEAETYARHPSLIGYDERAARERDRDTTRREIADANNESRRQVAQIRAAITSGGSSSAQISAQIRAVQARLSAARARLSLARDMSPGNSMESRLGQRDPRMSERFDMGSRLEQEALLDIESIEAELAGLQGAVGGGAQRPQRSFEGVRSGGGTTAPLGGGVKVPDAKKRADAERDPGYRKYLESRGYVF